MRVHVAALLLLTVSALAACTSTPPQGIPQSRLGRLIWQVRYQPPPTPAPQPTDQICLESWQEHQDELPAAVVRHLDGVTPDEHGPLYDVLDDAMDEVGVRGGGLSTHTSRSRANVWALAIGWCSPYGGTDVFIRNGKGDSWHVAHSDSPADLNAEWLDGTWLITQRSWGLAQTVKLWIVEQQSGEWVTVYEAEHRGLALGDTYFPPEAEISEQNGAHYLRLQYETGDETLVQRLYRPQAGGYVQVSGDELEAGGN